MTVISRNTVRKRDLAAPGAQLKLGYR